MLQYVLRRSTTIYPLYALLGMLYWPDDSLSLSLFLRGPWKDMISSWKTSQGKLLKYKKCHQHLSTIICGVMVSFFVFIPIFLRKWIQLDSHILRWVAQATKQWNIMQIVSSLHINHWMAGLKTIPTLFTPWAPTIVVNGVMVPIYGRK